MALRKNGRTVPERRVAAMASPAAATPLDQARTSTVPKPAWWGAARAGYHPAVRASQPVRC